MAAPRYGEVWIDSNDGERVMIVGPHRDEVHTFQIVRLSFRVSGSVVDESYEDNLLTDRARGKQWSKVNDAE